MDKDELLERYEALGEDGDFLAAKPLFEAEIQRLEGSEAGLHGPGGALLATPGQLAMRAAMLGPACLIHASARV
jgi:hypothetical protein